eukprot:gnl/MRDRNA2_/MRDRNA2_96903_c0_seq1.p1 gnl/MRDRNA2_/MRDRNA2_96903_c0~~gnl/MRDRNA2_/MRDRNA2_96903_c0_seq1.p1  ORF type:complete len:146 (-),score=16.48 gnl/MRDRNA2_/MRDRNA2_96903_c0_seq1:128-565(-)
MCTVLLSVLLSVCTVGSASEPLLQVGDATFYPKQASCNADGHAINITSVASEAIHVTLTGTYQGSVAGHQNFSLAPHAVHTVIACTSYGGYVLQIGNSQFNSEMQIAAQSNTVTDQWQVVIPQMQQWTPKIRRNGTMSTAEPVLV